MMNSADQLKNCATANRFMISGMPEKSPTMWLSMLVVLPPLASVIAMMLASP
jgi:hypothetical protein